ncbi:CDGSH iron-sulfur domain-containing protein 2 homolog A [Lingula anatina]|uniref:CDGSH iron-sulfur domain-containing protein 2 homolog A n=1 Tax=Lingula anatina TaxID=7574 RepID=A0A1S3IS31_LINAN|nr:CDGSH iron-sulfur domain-containing protein 2 homolog A [Lingula anatina]|eukprot:XP_013400746.1 CDGSH iron-sulfur domain-containing protein 2 homolog A [Lingula anatina]
METVSGLVRVSLPNYLKNLPFPDSFEGLADMSGGDWLRLLPFVGTVSLMVYFTVQAFLPSKKKIPINPDIQKECEKVATAVDIEDLAEKSVFCRCWRSKKFPYCDGTHNAHNKETGDNVGPLVIKRKS